MAVRWNNDAPPGVLAVIDAARTIYDLQRTMTGRSAAILPSKVARLLGSPDEETFEQNITELEVGALFGQRAGPIALEPMVGAEFIGTSAQPPSIDYAIRLPEGDIGIEVTTLRVAILDSWDRALAHLQKRIEGAISKGGLLKDVEILAPVGVRADQISRGQLRQLGRAFRERDSGQMTLRAGDVEVVIKWQPLPHLQLPRGSNPFSHLSPQNRAAVMSSGNVQVMHAAGFLVKPVIDPETFNEAVFQSVRNTVDGKEDQIKGAGGGPVLLVLHNGQRQVKHEHIGALLHSRLWPNRVYQWLTGVGLYSGRRSYQAGERAPKLEVYWNPSARHQPTAAFKAVIEEGAVYSKGVRVQAPAGEAGGEPRASA